MKSSISSIALAASILPIVFASPLRIVQERDVNVEWKYVTDVEVVTAYATAYATESAEARATYTAQATTDIMTSSAPVKAHGKNHWSYQQYSTEAATSTTEAAPTTSSTSTSTSTSSSTSTSTSSTEAPYTPPVVLPTTTSTTEAPAPTTTSSTSVVVSAASVTNAGPAVVTGDASYDSDNLQAAVMNSTNVWRAMFQAPAAVWNQSLADMALTTASACNWDHTNAGQNYAAGYSGPESAIDGWGGEYTQYNFAVPAFSDNAGHFTQLVWQDSTSTGCAAYHCPQSTTAQGWFFVCNYYPIGNWVMPGEFAANVLTKVS